MIRRMVSLVVLLLLLTACSNSGPAPSSKVTALPSDSLTTIRLGGYRGSTLAALDDVIAAFQNQNPGYRVEQVLTEYSMERFEQAEAELLGKASKGEIDLMLVNNRFLTSRQSHTLRPLDGFLAQSSLDQSRYGSLLEELKADGRIILLPYSIQPHLLIYNTEMAREAGVTVPKDRWTWDEFRTAVTRLSHGQGETKVWGLDAMLHDDFVYMYLRQKYGVALWQANYDQLRDALGFFSTLMHTDKAMKPLPRELAERQPFGWHTMRPLNEQKAAMTLEPSLNLPFAKNAGKVPWDVAPMPAFPGKKPVLRVMPKTVGLVSNSPQPEAAWKFLAFLAGPEGAEILARAGEIPAYFTEPASKALAGHQYPAGLESIWNADWMVELSPWKPSSGRSAHEADTAVLQALSGLRTVEDAIGYLKDRP